MRGYLLTENTTGRVSRLVAAARPRMLLTSAAVGVLAGLVISQVRLHLGLPGHKALLWMTPVILARLLGRHPAGATAGACAAACTSLALGGNLAGSILFVPLVAVAGGVLDVIIALAERWRLAGWAMVALVAGGGGAANLICAIKRLLAPMHHHHVLLGIAGPPACLLSYALFGLLAGATGAAVVLAAAAMRRRGDA